MKIVILRSSLSLSIRHAYCIVYGDLTFFHDLNGSAVAKTHPLNVTIIVPQSSMGYILNICPKRERPCILEYLFSTTGFLDYEWPYDPVSVSTLVRVSSNE